MGYKGNHNHGQGEFPESGAIFMSNTNTKNECLNRELFGLPSGMSDFVLRVKKGMTLFLFEFERRLLYGVFRATSDGQMNIDPKAFKSSGKYFPAQIRFKTVWDCRPLAEHEFKDVIKNNYYSAKKFNFGLNRKQVSKLMELFSANMKDKNRPERNIWSRDDKPTEENARSGDLRERIRHKTRSERRDFRGDEVKKLDDNMYVNKHIIEARQKDKGPGFVTLQAKENDELGEQFDIRKKLVDDGYMPVFSKSHGKHLEEDKDIDFNRLQDRYNVREGFQPSVNEQLLTRQIDNRDGFVTQYKAETDQFGDLRENHMEDCYMPLPVFSKPDVNCLDEINVGNRDFLMDGENRDLIDYNRLQDEYEVRVNLRESLSEHPLTDHVFPHLMSNTYDPTRINVPDIQLSPTLFDDGLSYIPISNSYPVYPKSFPYYSHDEGSICYQDDPGSQSSLYPKFVSQNLSASDAGLHVHEVDPIKSRMSTSLHYNYSHDERSIRYHDDPGSQSSIYPKFVSRGLSSSVAAGLHVHEVDPPDNDEGFREKRENKRTLCSTDKKANVFSRLTSTLRNEEQAFKGEADEKHELNSSVDKVMKMLEKAVSVPITRSGKSSSVVGHDDGDNSTDSNIEDVNLEGDADMAYEETEGELVFQETRLVDFKRRRKSNKPIDDSSKEGSDLLVGARATSAVGPVAIDQLTCMPSKRRKLVRPAFVEKISISNGVGAHGNTVSENDNVSANVVETSLKVDALVKSTDDIITVPGDSNLTKSAIGSSTKVDVSIKPSDLSMLTTSLEYSQNTPDDCNSAKALIESLKKADVLIKPGMNMLTNSLESALVNSNSTEAGIEGSKKVDVLMKPNDLNMPTPSQNTPVDKNSTKAGTESSTEIDVSIKPVDSNMLQTSDESSSSKDDNLTKAKASLESIHMSTACQKNGNEREENAENGLVLDVLLKPNDLNMLTPSQNTPVDNNSTKAGTETSTQGTESSTEINVSIKPVDLNMLQTSDESLSSKDDNLTKASVESIQMSTRCQRNCNGGEENSENGHVLDDFVERTIGRATKDDQNMCGWIEW